MAREPRAMRQDHPSGEFGGGNTHRGHAKLPMVGQGFVCLIGAFIVAVLSFIGRNPAREDDRMRLAIGEDGVGTTSLAVSSNGSLIATTDTAGRVAVRDEERGWRSKELADYEDFAVSVAVTPDGRFLAIGGIESGITLWDLEQENDKQTELLPQKWVAAMAFSPDGRSLAAASRTSTEVIVWDLIERREKMILTSRSPVLCLAFSPDGRYLASGERGNGASIYVWDLKTGCARRVLEGSSGPVVAVAFSPDGATLASAAQHENGVRLWDVSSGRSCRVIARKLFGTCSVTFSPNGGELALVGSDGMVRLCSVATGVDRAGLDGRANQLNRVAFSADGRILVATGSGDNHIRFWELVTNLVGDTT